MKCIMQRLVGVAFALSLLFEGTTFASELTEIFRDDFSSNTLSQYQFSWYGSTNASYDAANQRLKLTTEDNSAIFMVRPLPATSDTGYFEFQFYPYEVWPIDGIIEILALGNNSYYQFHFAHVSNTFWGQYTPAYRAYITKVVNGQTVFQKVFIPSPPSYSLNAWHTLGIRFSPESVTGYLDGQEIMTVIDPGAQNLSVGAFELMANQQYQYVDNVRCSLVLLNAAPVANPGPNLLVTSDNVGATVIHGMVSDSDGDLLTYRWLEDTTELLPKTPAGPSGEADLALASVAQLAIGSHVLTLEVTDGKATTTAKMELTIANAAPAAVVNGAATIEIGTPFSVTGTVSDFDGDMIAYRWIEAGTVLASGTVNTIAGGSPVAVPAVQLNSLTLGSHQVSLEVSDGINQPVVVSTTVTIIDTTAPTLMPTTSTGLLWPPNHQMVEVVISANASDSAGKPVFLEASAISTPSETTGSGSTDPDIIGPTIDQNTGVITFQLRAERPGKGLGRVYNVIITATDESGNKSTASLDIRAPHDRNSLPR